MPNPTAAMLVIGDEILSGRTRDVNIAYLAGALAAHGIDLKEARVVADDSGAIIAAVRALSATYSHVFTSGGIGPTHDDITADAIARGFGVEIGVRDDAKALLMAFFDERGVEPTPARMRMARIPDGATLIENPVSVAPGFTLGNVHVCAGVPRIFEAMVANVLAKVPRGQPKTSGNYRVLRPEGTIAAELEALALAHPELSIGSYPFHEPAGHGADIVVRGADPAEVEAVVAELARLFPGEAA